MDMLKKDWYTEIDEEVYPGVCSMYRAEEILYHARSKFQDICVFKNKMFGNVLVLDDRIQVTEKDEHSYQEMISFLPLNSHPNPERVLIIGGGDGGVAREVCKHPLVKHVTQCELDEDVINVCKKFLPSTAKGFDSPKLTLHIGDGFEFLAKHKNDFDVIITDSSDPEGPACVLFEKSYYELLHSALRENGIICCQGESYWLYTEFIRNILEFSGKIFPSVSYAQTQIPTYPSGLIGFVLCSLEKDKQFSKPVHHFDDSVVDELELKHYSSEMHTSAFVLPTALRKVLESCPSYRR